MSKHRSRFRFTDPGRVLIALLVTGLMLPHMVYSYSSGPPNGVTGAPGEGTCVDCHSSFPLNSGPGMLTISGPPAFEPGATYPISITLMQDGQSRWGFEFSPLDVGSCTITDPASTQLEMESGNTYVKHTVEGTFQGSPGPTTWSFDWTAPAGPLEEVTFYAAGNAANGNGSTSGDYIYTTTYTMGVVPVELTRFSAEIRTREVVLNWTTLSELNNAGFMVYRSEGVQYRLMTPLLIPGAGTTSIPQNYSFVDDTVLPGDVYRYRLSDVTLDGEETFHNPIRVVIPGSDEPTLQLKISPNPVQSGAVIQFSLPESAFDRMTLHDITGRALVTLAASDLSQGSNTVRLDLGESGRLSLPPGLYMCTVRAGDEAATSPLLVLP